MAEREIGPVRIIDKDGVHPYRLDPIIEEQKEYFAPKKIKEPHISIHARTNAGVLAFMFEGGTIEEMKIRATKWRDDHYSRSDYKFVVVKIHEEAIELPVEAVLS